MKSKYEFSYNESRTPKAGIPVKININDLKSKSNYQKGSKQYNVQLMILEDIKKLKVNLEITDYINKYKTIYFTELSLDELISLNDFFKIFNDYSEAFDYLLKNFTKIDRSKITYLNNNKDIKIVLLFSVNEIYEMDNNDTVKEEGIEVILHIANSNININKPTSNINSVINNLKANLEKNNLSIKEIKTNTNNDIIEINKKINELEKNFNKKITDIGRGNTNTITNSKKNDIGIGTQYDFDDKLNEIYTKFEEYENNILNIKQNIEEEYIKQRNEINNNNKIFIEKENELSQIITQKFEEFINKINSLDEKNYEIEANLNNKISELDSKTNICFNELIKKINNKNNNSIFSENDLKIKLNGIMGQIVEDNENLEKRLENKINKKLEDFKKEIKEEIQNEYKLDKNNNNNDNNNDIINSKIKELEEKINNYEKIINDKIVNIEEKKDLNELSIKIDDLQKNIKENDLNINENKVKINELDNKIIELYEKVNQKNIDVKDIIKNNSLLYNNEKEKEIASGDYDKIFEEINNIKEENNKKLKEFENKIEELNTMINKINDNLKEENNEINNKILLLKVELSKATDNKNNSYENKIKSLDWQLTFNNDENKIKEIDINKKSYSSLKKKDSSLRNIDGNIELRKIKDSYLTRTLSNSNSNGSLTQNTGLHLYKSTLQNKKEIDKKDLNISQNEVKDKKYFYNLSNNINIKTNKIKEKNVFDLSIDSNILKSEEINENFFIFSKLKEIYPYKRSIKLTLIYRASKDGDLAKNFHHKCDFIGANLTFIKTKEGYIFGGFTIKNWKHLYKDNKKDDPENGTEYKDDKAFGFSINNNKIYENGIPDREIIYCNNNYGPCFKNFFFKIYDECFKNGGICGTNEESNFIGIDKDYEYNGGEQKINVEEIEVFQIGSK